MFFDKNCINIGAFDKQTTNLTEFEVNSIKFKLSKGTDLDKRQVESFVDSEGRYNLNKENALHIVLLISKVKTGCHEK